MGTLGRKVNERREIGPLEPLPSARGMKGQAGYGQSKWVAEQLVVRAREEGLKTTIHRCGMLCWSSKTGAGNYVNRDMRILGTVLMTRLAPMSNASWKILPADYAAKMISTFSQDAKSGEVFHIVNPSEGTPWAHLLDPSRWLKASVNIRTVPHGEWYAQVEKLKPGKIKILQAGIRENYRAALSPRPTAIIVDPRHRAFSRKYP